MYATKDVTFRGFRHSGGTGNKIDMNIKAKNVKAKVLAIQGNETMDGASDPEAIVNWEASTTSDGDRFSLKNGKEDSRKTLKSFDEYLEKKELRKLMKAQSKSSTNSTAHH